MSGRGGTNGGTGRGGGGRGGGRSGGRGGGRGGGGGGRRRNNDAVASSTGADTQGHGGGGGGGLWTALKSSRDATPKRRRNDNHGSHVTSHHAHTNTSGSGAGNVKGGTGHGVTHGNANATVSAGHGHHHHGGGGNNSHNRHVHGRDGNTNAASHSQDKGPQQHQQQHANTHNNSHTHNPRHSHHHDPKRAKRESASNHNHHYNHNYNHRGRGRGRGNHQGGNYNTKGNHQNHSQSQSNANTHANELENEVQHDGPPLFEGGFYLKQRRLELLEFVGTHPSRAGGKAYLVRVKDAHYQPHMKIKGKNKGGHCHYNNRQAQTTSTTSHSKPNTTITSTTMNAPQAFVVDISSSPSPPPMTMQTLSWPSNSIASSTGISEATLVPSSFTPLKREEQVLPALLRWGKKERGMMKHQPPWRLPLIEKACGIGIGNTMNESTSTSTSQSTATSPSTEYDPSSLSFVSEYPVPLRQALSLRRHHMRRYNPYLRNEALGLGNEADVRESAELFERAVERQLQSQGIAFWTEHDQHRREKEQARAQRDKMKHEAATGVENGHGESGNNTSKAPPMRRYLTPDFVFPRPVVLKDHTYIELEYADANAETSTTSTTTPVVSTSEGSEKEGKDGENENETTGSTTPTDGTTNTGTNDTKILHWMEVKHFYGASTICADGKSAVGSILAKAKKYVDFFGGGGAIVFGYGCGEVLAAELALLGVVALGCGPVAVHNMAALDQHMATYCGDEKGRILP
jgi:hypothetical protein